MPPRNAGGGLAVRRGPQSSRESVGCRPGPPQILFAALTKAPPVLPLYSPLSPLGFLDVRCDGGGGLMQVVPSLAPSLSLLMCPPAYAPRRESTRNKATGCAPPGTLTEQESVSVNPSLSLYSSLGRLLCYSRPCDTRQDCLAEGSLRGRGVRQMGGGGS